MKKILIPTFISLTILLLLIALRARQSQENSTSIKPLQVDKPGATLSTTKDKNGYEYVSGEIIVIFEDGTTYKQVKELFLSKGLTNFKSNYPGRDSKNFDDQFMLEFWDSFIVSVNPGQEKTIVDDLNKENIVRAASTNGIIKGT